jgi:hypothetical protein
MHGRLIFTAGFHGVLAMGSAYFLTMLNSLEPFVKKFANQSLSSHYNTAVTDGQLGQFVNVLI